MSSVAVRTLVTNFLAAESEEAVVDLTGQFEDLRQLLAESSVTPDSPWLGLEFLGDEEVPVSLAADNDKGCYREFGTIMLHVCAIGKIGVGSEIITRAEVLRNLFRGRRIGAIVIESVSPVNTGRGATLDFDAGYVSGSVAVSYYCDIFPGT